MSGKDNLETPNNPSDSLVDSNSVMYDAPSFDPKKAKEIRESASSDIKKPKHMGPEKQPKQPKHMRIIGEPKLEPIQEPKLEPIPEPEPEPEPEAEPEAQQHEQEYSISENLSDRLNKAISEHISKRIEEAKKRGRSEIVLTTQFEHYPGMTTCVRYLELSTLTGHLLDISQIPKSDSPICSDIDRPKSLISDIVHPEGRRRDKDTENYIYREAKRIMKRIAEEYTEKGYRVTLDSEDEIITKISWGHSGRSSSSRNSSNIFTSLKDGPFSHFKWY